jgi:hypothetical protein
MITLRWCEHCQNRAAHRDGDACGGLVVWVNGTRHDLPDGYVEKVCMQCGAHTLDYYEDDPSDAPVYHANTTDEAT